MLRLAFTRSAVISTALASLLTSSFAISTVPKPIHGLHGHAHGGPTWRRANHVHIDLMECKKATDTGFDTLQMALYFSGEPDDTPRVSIDAFSYAKQPGWAGTGDITGLFPDQGPFTVNIPRVVSEGQLAGSGYNGKKEPWSCSAAYKESSYATQDGTVCNRAYICRRAAKSSAPTPAPTPTASPSPPSNPSSSEPPAPALTRPSELTIDSNQGDKQPDNQRNSQEDSGNTSPSTPAATVSTTPSSQPSGPSSPAASTPPANKGATGSDKDAVSDSQTAPSSDLTTDQKIAIGLGVPGGVFGLGCFVLAILAWRYPKKRKEIVNRFSMLNRKSTINN